MGLDKELEIAREVAVRAGEIALHHQRAGVTAETKLDRSPVSAADRESEQAIACALEEAFPEDGLLGEEGLNKPSRSGRRWIVDPLDGTRDFLRGIPTWAVLIALENGPHIEVGVCHFPAQRRTFYAARGGGAFCDGRPIRISPITDRGASVLCVNGFTEVLEHGFGPRLLEWMKHFWAVRSFGGCQDAVLVAEGKAEAWIDPSGKAWDFAALKLIGEEAGAVFFNFDGGRSIYGGNCVICAPALEGELRRFVLGAENPSPQRRRGHRESTEGIE